MVQRLGAPPSVVHRRRTHGRSEDCNVLHHWSDEALLTLEKGLLMVGAGV